MRACVFSKVNGHTWIATSEKSPKFNLFRFYDLSDKIWYQYWILNLDAVFFNKWRFHDWFLILSLSDMGFNFFRITRLFPQNWLAVFITPQKCQLILMFNYQSAQYINVASPLKENFLEMDIQFRQNSNLERLCEVRQSANSWVKSRSPSDWRVCLCF